MSAVNQHFHLDVGEDRTISFTVTSDGTTAINITAYTIAWKLYTHPMASSAALTVAGVITDAANGVCTVTVADTDTDSLEPRVYWHQLKVTDGSANESVVSRGNVTLKPAKT
jgi:hypothetical protein